MSNNLLLPQGWTLAPSSFYACQRLVDYNVRLEVLYLASENAFVGKVYSPLSDDWGITVDLPACKSMWTAALAMNALYKSTLENYATQSARSIVR